MDLHTSPPTQECIRLMVNKDYQGVVSYFRDYIKKNPRACYMRVYGDPVITNNGQTYIWVYIKNKKHIFDTSLHNGELILHNYELVSTREIKYNICPFSEVKTMNDADFKEFTIGIKHDDVNDNYSVCDATILFNVDDSGYKKIEYIDPNEDTITPDEMVEELTEKYEGDLVPLIREAINRKKD